MDAYAIKKLHKYGVTIEYDPTVTENRGYVFTSSLIKCRPERCVRFQHAIELMVMALERNPSFIRPFLKQ